MKSLIAAAAFLMAGAAWAVEKPLPVIVRNPSVTVQAADAGDYSHVGQKPSRLVNLHMLASASHRIDPDTGIMDSSTSFIVPDGFVFVLTNIQGSGGCTPGDSVQFTVTHRNLVLNSTIDRIHLVCASNDVASFDRHYATGLVFAAGSGISVEAFNVFNHRFVTGQGYLVPAG